MNKIGNDVRASLDLVPELKTSVALTASLKQQEVGGIACLGLAGVAIYFMY